MLIGFLEDEDKMQEQIDELTIDIKLFNKAISATKDDIGLCRILSVIDFLSIISEDVYLTPYEKISIDNEHSSNNYKHIILEELGLNNTTGHSYWYDTYEERLNAIKDAYTRFKENQNTEN